MKRRDVIRAVAAAGAAWPAGARAQAPSRTYRIGLLGRVDNKRPLEALLAGADEVIE